MQIQNLAENLGLDVEDFNELFELYVETTSSELKELKAAIDAGDAEKVHEKAHSLKGSSGNLGFNELYESAKAIDDLARVNTLDGLEAMVQEFSEKYERLVEKLS